ncbi:DUF1566 domain-containing protein [Labilibaculum sp.]|uniref:Lcl C-terminal domain-containing protein n=1 Tax=Labilibaculum sp. TaxID=2060723 RepID=UPI00356266F9
MIRTVEITWAKFFSNTFEHTNHKIECMKEILRNNASLLLTLFCLSCLSSCDAPQTKNHNFTLTQTGQVGCYGTAGDTLSHLKAGDDFYGQHADYKKGVPLFYTDNGDGSITDRLSGLTRSQNQSENGMRWEEAKQYCENLRLAGHEDWRLPTLKEL